MTIHRYDNTSAGAPAAIPANIFPTWDSIERNAIQPFKARALASWMTEFDLSDRSTDFRYCGTWLHGPYVAQMVLQFLSEPSVTQIDIYNLHSDSKRSSLAYDGRETLGLDGWIRTESGALSASGHASQLLGEALEGATSVAPLIFSNEEWVFPAADESFKPYPALHGVALSHGSGAQEDGYVLVNLSPHRQRVQRVSASAHATLRSLSAGSLSAPVVNKDSLTEESRDLSSSTFEVPGYSVSWVRNLK